VYVRAGLQISTYSGYESCDTLVNTQTHTNAVTHRDRDREIENF